MKDLLTQRGRGKWGINKALADLEDSISLIPYLMFLRLNLGELKPMRMCIELANKSTQIPRGIAENVIFKIDRFPVIISSLLSAQEKELLLGVLAKHKGALAWKVTDIKGYFQIPLAPEDQEKIHSLVLMGHSLIGGCLLVYCIMEGFLWRIEGGVGGFCVLAVEQEKKEKT
nr:hypothetical protein [Tanacetum cinerariifolium]